MYLQDKVDPKTGKYKFSYRFWRWFHFNKTTLKVIFFVTSIFTASLILGNLIFGGQGNEAPLFAFGVTMTTMMFWMVLIHGKSRHRHPHRKPVGASFQRRNNLDADPKEVDRRLEEMQAPDDPPEGT